MAKSNIGRRVYRRKTDCPSHKFSYALFSATQSFLFSHKSLTVLQQAARKTHLRVICVAEITT